jgi:hypothetical protein
LQQAFVAVVDVPLTEVAFAPVAAEADLEQAFPPALDLQQEGVFVAVLTVAAVAEADAVFDLVQAVFDFEQVFVGVALAAAALAAA